MAIIRLRGLKPLDPSLEAEVREAIVKGLLEIPGLGLTKEDVKISFHHDEMLWDEVTVHLTPSGSDHNSFFHMSAKLVELISTLFSRRVRIKHGDDPSHPCSGGWKFA